MRILVELLHFNQKERKLRKKGAPYVAEEHPGAVIVKVKGWNDTCVARAFVDARFHKTHSIMTPLEQRMFLMRLEEGDLDPEWSGDHGRKDFIEFARRRD